MSINAVMSPAAMNLILLGTKAQLITGGNCKMKLFQNDFTPNNTQVLADFTIATYDGYADGTVNWSFGPSRNPDGSFSIANNFNFPMTGSTTPNIIYGCYVTDFAGTTLLFANRFDTPVPMVDAFSVCTFRHHLTLPVNGITIGGVLIP